MTHYVKTIFSDKTICEKLAVEVLRVDDDVTPVLENVTCDKCIIKLEGIILKIKNNNPVTKDA
jgi:hypothetical protein